MATWLKCHGYLVTIGKLFVLTQQWLCHGRILLAASRHTWLLSDLPSLCLIIVLELRHYVGLFPAALDRLTFGFVPNFLPPFPTFSLSSSAFSCGSVCFLRVSKLKLCFFEVVFYSLSLLIGNNFRIYVHFQVYVKSRKKAALFIITFRFVFPASIFPFLGYI